MTTDATVNVPSVGEGVQIDNTLIQRDGKNVYRQRVECYSGEVLPTSSGVPISYDTSSRNRVSQIVTLFDGKILNAENTLKWDTQGTGSSTYIGNAMRLSVAANQYEIRQAKVFTPYFSGKPQLVEMTFANFKNEAGVIKRYGYFSSNAVAPYDSDKDGWWVEADGTTYRLICSRSGTIVHNIPWTEWDNYAAISNYDWTKFTVSQVDFLWLGGAALRLFFVINGVFTLVHTIDNHAGYQSGLIFLSPNQPARYEIRSTGGAGSFDTICSQIASEGASANELGEGVSIYTGSIACNVIGTVYALAGMRKTVANRNIFAPVTSIGVTNILTSATPESGLLLLMLNPTLSAPLNWVANSRIETAVATNQTVTNQGRLLQAIPASGSALTSPAASSALRVLSSGLANNMDELVIGYTPTTTTQNVAATMQALEYA